MHARRHVHACVGADAGATGGAWGLGSGTFSRACIWIGVASKFDGSWAASRAISASWSPRQISRCVHTAASGQLPGLPNTFSIRDSM